MHFIYNRRNGHYSRASKTGVDWASQMAESLSEGETAVAKRPRQYRQTRTCVCLYRVGIPNKRGLYELVAC